MKRVSKGFFLGSVAVGFGISHALVIVGGLQLLAGDPESGLAMVGLALIPMLYGAIINLVLWYKMWAAIQDGHARTTPGKAIGFLFIPLFNIYWAFQAIPGFSKDCNKYIERRGITAERLPEGLFLAYVILGFVAWIPVLGLTLPVVAYFILLVMTSKICDAINAIAEVPAKQIGETAITSTGAEAVVTALTTVTADFQKKRRLLRLVVRCCALTIAVIFALPVLPWSWTPLVLPSLSPHILICSAVAARVIGVATLVGLPMLVFVLVRRRCFCRYACPVGLLAEYTGRLRSTRKGRGPIVRKEGKGPIRRNGLEGAPHQSAQELDLSPFSGKLPPMGQWVVLLTVGGALFGYPLFLWLDPLAIFQVVLTESQDPSSLAGQLSAVVLAFILSISLLLPGAWCTRLCPLGATQDLLALPQRLFRRRTSPTGSPPADGKWALSRRSFFSIALGAACLGLGTRWGSAASKRSSRHQPGRLRPPGAIDPERFTGLCVRCGNCVRACPTKIIRRDLGQGGFAGFLAPAISFAEDYCREDCHACTEVCPSGAITLLSLEEKQKSPIGLAKLDASICLLADDRECDVCARVCPFEAIDIVWHEEEYIALPHVDPEKCPGCGACEVACPGTNEWEREHASEPIPLRKAIEVGSLPVS